MKNRAALLRALLCAALPTFSPSLARAEPSKAGSLEKELWAAAQAGATDAVIDLLKRGADIEAKARGLEFGNGLTALGLAAVGNKADTVKALLEHGAAIEARSPAGLTPLMLSGPEAAKALLDRGANIEATTDLGFTVLMNGALMGHVEKIRVLLDRGARINAVHRGSNETPLLMAVGYNYKDAAKLLLERGADTAIRDDKGRTALEVAEERGYHEMAALIREHGSQAAGSARSPAQAGVSKDDLQRMLDAAAEKAAEKAISTQAGRAEPKPAAQIGPSEVDRPSYRLAENPEFFAVVAGVEKYADLPAAAHAERDAEAVAAHLEALGVPRRNLVLLLGAQASRGSLQKNLETWLARNAGEGSTIFFYFSGHGGPDPKTGQAYLIPSDGDPQYLEDTAYPLSRLYKKLDSLKAKRVIVALDACFSGAGGRSVLPKGARPLVNVVDLGTAKLGKVSVLTAAGPDEITGALEGERHGTFTYFLLKGLNGAAKGRDGKISVRSLHDYLAPKVADEGRRANRDQRPRLLGTDLDVPLR